MTKLVKQIFEKLNLVLGAPQTTRPVLVNVLCLEAGFFNEVTAPKNS